MSPETIAIVANIAAALLGAAALVISFYVRATVGEKSAKDCETLETKVETKIEAVEKELGAKIEAVDKAHGDGLERAIGRLHERVAGYEARIRNLEVKIDSNAKQDELHKVAIQITEVSGDMKAILARMSSMEENSKVNAASLRRLEDHVLNIEK
jgi:DNA relaxase NicK